MGNARTGKGSPRDESREAIHRHTEAASDEVPEQEPEHHLSKALKDDPDHNVPLASPEFQRALDIICQSVFKRFGPSPRFSEWQDLRQETLLHYVAWLENYESKASPKSILNRIATNLCIDEEHHQKAQIRAHTEVDPDEIDLETLRNPISEDTDRRILLKECRSQFTGRKLLIFDEYFIEGRSLREIAKHHGFAPQTAVNLLAGILKEARQFVLGRIEFGEGVISIESGRRPNARARRQRGAADRITTSATKVAESKLEQMLLEAGLLSEIPPRITDFKSYKKRKPVRVKGKPVSETIIEERR